ncbi:MAG: GTPase HflX [Coriobacteriia bacterium]|nr:GTPase HflX [Coriobacteriia bacterium]
MARNAYEVVNDVERRAILVGVDRHRSDAWTLEDDLAELTRLVDTWGARVIGVITQRLERPNPRTFIGAGKAAEVEVLAREEHATTVIFDDDLTPSQQSNLEGLLPNVRVIDRTQLILDIFAIHAESHEGKLQVELARLEYVLPRLRGMWGHLEAERLGGGRGARFGAGESQLETDRRLTRKRIADLRRELKHVARTRDTQRAARGSSGVFRIALIGYTNTGKSTLLNALTGAGVLTQDQLFATLDATTRRLALPDGRAVTLTDTVGFINKLPHGLIEAFKSTLDEVREADLLLHVVDASHPNRDSQIRAVNVVLDEIGAADRPQLIVYNKADLVPALDCSRLARDPGAAVVAAATGEGLDALLERIATIAAQADVPITVTIPYAHGELVQLAHEQGHILSEEHLPEGTRMTVVGPASVRGRLSEFLLPDHGMQQDRSER